MDYNSASPSQGSPNGNETVGVGTGGEGGAVSCYGQIGNRGAVILYNVPAATVTIVGSLLINGVAPGVVKSTTVYMDTGQALGTGLWPACFTNSTATLTGVTSSCVMVLASGSWLLDSAGYNYGLALVVNGVLVPGTDNSKRSHGQVWELPSGAGYVWPFNIAEQVCGMWPSTTTVNVCLTGSAENSATLAGTSGSHTARKPTLSIIEVRK